MRKEIWGYAPENCEGMWKMLQLETPEDFVLATGETHTVREFCELAFKHLGFELEWSDSGQKEIGIVKGIDISKLIMKDYGITKLDLMDKLRKKLKAGDVLIEIDSGYFRPTEVDILAGKSTKAKIKLGWESNTNLVELIKIMVDSDCEKTLANGITQRF